MTEPASPDRLVPASAPAGLGEAETAGSGHYRVLARKYRPATFAGLIGQEAMVRTLTNAFQSGRLAHAFILTGVRGVGKTTTARIVARALNCVGADGTGGPTIDPCGVCAHCRAIAEDRHVDVLEMDAASRTGVDDIRELIEGVRYRPTTARYKVYIIDEVHMLSKNAFNALLKTLEEPPERVKFIFATTEVRKVPVTVLSRCQRFDLRRVDADRLATHLAAIAEAEGVKVAPPALDLIARAADGSVRDGLSLLDQAIALAGDGEAGGDGEVGGGDVRGMLGLVDRTVTFELLGAAMKGDIRAALEVIADQYRAGADPAVVLEDMLDLTHWLTRIKVVPEAADRPGVAEAERVRGREMAKRLSMAALTRAWQMLLKGLGEVRTAPLPVQAAEMILVRLAYAAELPTPAEAVKATTPEAAAQAPAPVAGPQERTGAPAPVLVERSPASRAGGGAAASRVAPAAPSSFNQSRTRPEATAEPEAPASEEADRPDPATFADVVALLGERREALLHANLFSNVHLVRFEPGRIEFRPGEHAPADLANQLSRFLNDCTARRWVVTVASEPGQPTLSQQAAAATAQAKAEAGRHPLVRAVIEAFPGATIAEVRTVAAPEAGSAVDSPPAEGDEDA